MAKKTERYDSAALSQNDLVDALSQVTAALTAAANQLNQFTQSTTTGAPMQAATPGVQVSTWDDPFSEALPSVNPPVAIPRAVPLAVNANPRLRTVIVDPQPPVALYPPGTAGFRYWVAAEALARGINFWGALMPVGTTWSTSNPMRVILVDAGPELNARYRRNDGLHFYRRLVQNVDVHSSESPDVVCHELGHAVLDALRPQLFNTADAETGAFHEAFGDVSSILCALQIDWIRKGVLSETNGRLNINSRLSRLAEQLGWGIRQLSPTAVDRDSLRNAANRFFYRRIDLLPPSAPANLLSSEVHSFSRVFTGAFLDALARMLSATGAPNEASLLSVSRDCGQLIVDAVRAAPITTGYFSQVAAAMLQADQARFGGRNRAALNGAFLERGILSVNSAMAMANAPVPRAAPQEGAGMAADPQRYPGGFQSENGAPGSSTVYAYGADDQIADDGFRLGYGETPELPSMQISIGGLTIDVHAPVQPQRFEVASAMVGSDPEGALSADTAARLFIEGLIQRRELDLGPAMSEIGDTGTKVSGGSTHSLVTEGRKQILKRNHFDCGFCARRTDKPALACV
jgi:hypothetical protein